MRGAGSQLNQQNTGEQECNENDRQRNDIEPRLLFFGFHMFFNHARFRAELSFRKYENG